MYSLLLAALPALAAGQTYSTVGAGTCEAAGCSSITVEADCHDAHAVMDLPWQKGLGGGYFQVGQSQRESIAGGCIVKVLFTLTRAAFGLGLVVLTCLCCGKSVDLRHKFNPSTTTTAECGAAAGVDKTWLCICLGACGDGTAQRTTVPDRAANILPTTTPGGAHPDGGGAGDGSGGTTAGATLRPQPPA
jgi:hypothetical protein